MWQIVIVMLGVANVPDDVYPVTPDVMIEDAIKVEYLDGKPLNFPTKEKCLEHMWDNIEELKAFGSASFDGAPVKTRSCSPIGGEVDV